MKPPSRARIQPTRYVNKKTEKTVSKRKPKFACTGWSRTEQQVLLRCLNKQNKMTGGIHGAIDLEALHEKLPKQSREEIQSQLESLMMRVLRAVVGQVKRQRSEQKAALKPIQLWAELAHDMAGALEEPITSAFAQMLVISATEPGSLTNSDPPREDYLPKQQRSNFKTIPPRPIPTPKNPAPSGVSNSPIVFNIASTPQPPPAVSVPVSGVPTTQPSTMNPSSGASNQRGRTTTPASTVGAQPQPGCSNSSILSQIQEGSAITPLLTVPMPVQSLSASSSGPTTTLQSQSVPQGGAHGQTMSNVPSTQLAVMSSPAPAGVSKQQQPSAAASSIRPQPQHPGAGPRKSKHADENTPRYTGLGSIVDFEKIYRFLSTVHVQSECFRLTPMESAIILDLLMSLPEELPLLDCARLQHHLLQVHERFSAPVPKVSQVGTGTGRPWSSAAGGEGTKAGDQRRQDGGTDGGAILVAVTTPPSLDAGDKVGAPLQIQQESQVGGRDGAISGIPDGRGSDGMECTSTNQGVAATVVPVNLVAGCSNSVAKDGAVPLQGSTEERAGTETFAPSQDNGQAQGQTPSTNDASAKSGTATQRKPDWEKAGLCPLNPFMVPLKLLARQQIQSVEEVVLQ